MELISLVVPCYNEQEALPYFYDAFVELADQMKNDVNFEVVFVNDGSKDKTLSVLRELSKKDERVQYISFSRNFGKEPAMLAGFEKAKGDYVSIMDADLQDPPELIKEMYKIIKEQGVDCVGTRRTTRKGEPPIRSFFANAFYKIINKISDTEIVNGARDYRLMTRQMVDSIISMKEYNRFSKGIFSFVGYETVWLEYENIERVAGKTSWSFWGLFKYSLEGILSFSTVPLHISSLLGIILCLLSIIYVIIIIIKTIVFGEVVAGYPTIICMVTLLGGIQLFSIGILGQYLAKMYIETKKRPIYIIKEQTDK